MIWIDTISWILHEIYAEGPDSGRSTDFMKPFSWNKCLWQLDRWNYLDHWFLLGHLSTWEIPSGCSSSHSWLWCWFQLHQGASHRNHDMLLEVGLEVGCGLQVESGITSLQPSSAVDCDGPEAALGWESISHSELRIWIFLLLICRASMAADSAQLGWHPTE